MISFRDFINWARAQGSVAKYNDGNFLGECVSLINQYCWRVLNVPADSWGHAKDWGKNAIQREYFDVLDRGVPVQEGDILVYGEDFGGGLGHIELAINQKQAIFQNRNTNGRVGVGPILPGFYAILRPKNKGGAMDSEDVKFIYLLGRNSEPNQDEYNYWKGQKPSDLAAAIYFSAENHNFRKGAMEYPKIVRENEDLKKKLASAPLGEGEAAKRLNALSKAVKDIIEVKGVL